MKKGIALLTALLLLAAFQPVSALTLPSPADNFEDVDSDAWYWDAIRYVSETGLMEGTSETTFAPGETMTRGMLVTVLGRSQSVETTYFTALDYTDVSPTAYYAPYVVWADREGIVTGVGEDRFAPSDAISRQDIAVMLCRMVGPQTNEIEDSVLDDFEDADQISDYAVGAMKWAVENGILQGSDGRLTPRDTATRAQVAQMLLNFDDLHFTPDTRALFAIDREDIGYIQLRNGTNGAYADLAMEPYELIVELLDSFRYTTCEEAEPLDGWSYMINIGQADTKDDILLSIVSRDKGSIEVNGVTYQTRMEGHFHTILEEWVPDVLFTLDADDYSAITLYGGDEDETGITFTTDADKQEIVDILNGYSYVNVAYVDKIGSWPYRIVLEATDGEETELILSENSVAIGNRCYTGSQQDEDYFTDLLGPLLQA